VRIGYAEMIDLMRRGEVSVVLVHDMSRTSRNMIEGPQFVRAIFEHGILLEVNGRLYDGAKRNLGEELSLYIQTLMAWWDQAQRTETFRRAKLAKAARGLAVTPVTEGFVSFRGKWE